MGDVAMTVPVLLAFRQNFPEVKITVVSRNMFKPLFEQISNVDFYGFEPRGRNKGILGIYRCFKDLSTLKIDAVADLHNVMRSKILRGMFAVSGKKTAFINKGRDEKNALTRSHDKVFKQLKHSVERYLDVFSELGFNFEISPENLLPKLKLSAAVKDFAGNHDCRWIGIAPFAQHSPKTYPIDLIEKVVEKLAQSNVKIFLFGSIDDVQQLQNLAFSENITVVAGKFSFAEELELISNLDVMLSMDSGNAHLSAIYNVPTITLWGATHPFAGFAPWLQPNGNMLLADRDKFPAIPTSIYGNKIVEGSEDAMRSISVTKVVEKTLQLLK